MRLLIVDDDPVFREELGDLLESDGHDTRSVASVAAAIEALEADEFEVVLTDLKMPRRGGLELLAEVQKRWPRTLTVMITGFATVDTAVEAMKLGAFDYLRKPFRVEQVQRVLALAAEESRFENDAGSPESVEALLHRWTEVEGMDVMLATARNLPARPRLTIVPTGTLDAAHVRDAVEAFLQGHERGAVVVEGIDGLFHGRKRAELLDFVVALKERTAGHGPFVVTYDPARTRGVDAQDLRAVLVGVRTRSTLEALSNPIRRAVLRRSREGPISFSQAMESAGLDDSPKLSFHLRRLVDESLLRHSDEAYRITPRGEECLRLLATWDAVVSSDALAAALPQARP
ncbi:MAG TPA: response regulator [Thermoplasmata archaeon]|nr:response regulator [Thermoplasmata archaeon]